MNIQDEQLESVLDWAVRPILKPGGRTCQCADCGLFFTGVAPFDKHLKGIGWGCFTQDEMRDGGMTANEYGVWSSGTRSQAVA